MENIYISFYDKGTGDFLRAVQEDLADVIVLIEDMDIMSDDAKPMTVINEVIKGLDDILPESFIWLWELESQLEVIDDESQLKVIDKRDAYVWFYKPEDWAVWSSENDNPVLIILMPDTAELFKIGDIDVEDEVEPILRDVLPEGVEWLFDVVGDDFVEIE